MTKLIFALIALAVACKTAPSPLLGIAIFFAVDFLLHFSWLMVQYMVAEFVAFVRCDTDMDRAVRAARETRKANA